MYFSFRITAEAVLLSASDNACTLPRQESSLDGDPNPSYVWGFYLVIVLELEVGVAASSVERSHAQKFTLSMAERKRTKSAVWDFILASLLASS